MATTEQQGSAVLSQLLDQGKVNADQRELTQKGLSSFLEKIIEENATSEKISSKLIDSMLNNIDQKISAQMDVVLHNAEFQKLEATWRGLDYLLQHTNFHENIRIDLLYATKDELHEDLEDAPSITESGLYKTIYTGEYGQFGGQPYGAIIGGYEFGAGSRDVNLLREVGAVASMSFAPFIGGTAPEFFNLTDWRGLPDLKDLDVLFEMPQYGAWNSFRQSDVSRNVGLVLPRFLSRMPYGASSEPVKGFNYTESVVNDTDYAWANAAFAFASRITDSFAQYRWASNIVGPNSGGKVDDLPLYNYEALGNVQTKIPTQTLISERREFELAENGFIPLTMRKNGGDAVFFSANSAQLAKKFPDTAEGKAAELNFRLGTQLPYMFLVSRLAHYIKVLQRENLGSWKTRADVESELNKWLGQYVVDMVNPGPEVRSKKPFRNAEVVVEEVPGEAGWYRCTLNVSPHFKYMGANFTLSLVGKLEKKAA